MPKVKVPRKSTMVDMTAMVDMGFLLVTFFMLATKFRPDEPVMVDTPSSVATEIVDDKSLFVVTVAKDKRVFFGLEDREVKEAIMKKMIASGKVKLAGSEGEVNEKIKKYGLQSSFGLPFSQIDGWLSEEPENMKEFPQIGIPIDSLGGELIEWLFTARSVRPKFQVAIKGDAETNYPTIKNVFNALANDRVNAYKFKLVTDLEENRLN